MPIRGLGMPQSAISRFCVRQNRLIFAVPYKDCPACKLDLEKLRYPCFLRTYTSFMLGLLGSGSLLKS